MTWVLVSVEPWKIHLYKAGNKGEHDESYYSVKYRAESFPLASVK